MSSTTRLLVLGVVKLFQPVHGYVVRRELLSWRAQDWASVQPGSIYNALKTLTRDGLIEIASTDQVGGRPERTTYRLTPAGEDEFQTLLREAWWNVRVMFDPLMSAVSFLGEIPRAEAIAALEHRTAQIQGMVRHTEFAISALDPDESPDHVREMMRLINARLSSELAWSEEFIARLRNREYRTVEDPRWIPRSAQQASAERTPRGAAAARRADGPRGHAARADHATPASPGRAGDPGARPGRARRTTAPAQPGRDGRPAQRRSALDLGEARATRPGEPRSRRRRAQAGPEAPAQDHARRDLPTTGGRPAPRADRRGGAWSRSGRRPRTR